MLVRRILKKVAARLADIRFLIKSSQQGKKCILISHELSQTGAPVLLYRFAKVLKNNGYTPIIISVSNGPAAKMFTNSGITVIVTYGSKNIKNYIKKCNCEFVLFSSIASISWVEDFQTCKKRMIWWIYEGRVYISKFKNRFLNLDLADIEMWFVSKWVESEMKNASIAVPPHKIIPFGIENDYILRKEMIDKIIQENKSERYSIGIFGSITERKNQLQLIEAIMMLPETIRSNIDLRIVGGGSGSYFEKIKEISSVNENIILVPPVSLEKLYLEYLKCDLVVCCSIDDSGPMVIPEAIMYQRRVLCSSGTGQYFYLADFEPKCVYEIGSTRDLSNKILLAYNERMENLVERRCYELFLREFEQPAFERRIVEVIEGESK